jgi:hypothetical protein
MPRKDAMKMRLVSFLPVVGLIGVLFLAVGCRSNCDLVEAELRARESDLDHVRAELYRAEAQNQALARELHDLRHTSAAKPLPEVAAQTGTVSQVVLGRQTGGYDDDNCPGDEALQVVLEPRDTDGQSIKAPGALRVVVLQVSAEGLKAPLSSWELSPDQLRRTWHNGLLSTGYHVILPWKTWPTSPRLRVIAQFSLADGRIFEADKDVTVHLPPPAYRTAPIEPGPEVAPAPRPAPVVDGPPLISPVQLLRPARRP